MNLEIDQEWLKEGGDEMIESLTTIFNRVEEERQTPLQWRETSIKSQRKTIRKAREVFS